MSLLDFVTIWNNYWTADRVLFAAYVFCAAVQAMGKPTEASSRFYSWFFRFTHILAGNINVAKKESDRISDGKNDIRTQREMAKVQKLQPRREPSLHEESVM